LVIDYGEKKGESKLNALCIKFYESIKVNLENDESELFLLII
jgi:hypothetical protein